MTKINQFIYREIALVKDRYQTGVYSREFALGHLSGLSNLAVHYKQQILMKNIYSTAAELCSSEAEEKKAGTIPNFVDPHVCN
ncbi:hypothetical protein YDYSY3_38540 [Paenibacillus chitinolyticus]|uniref:hypothetical protein n=1 Tax=Paenibacillus chitinolyticus TaxID=79263 RepID=UPI0026E4F3F9|nr:hypothetical protein [Paenibacillus chitinolyticus]GKS12854.1 hypothetical protein YDYSY3_38540 [Paenibacillus chitinolyticus]